MRKPLLLGFLTCSVLAVAQTINLDQNWQLLPDPEAKYTLATLPETGWRPLRVGISWNAQFDDMRDFGGVGWYRIDLPSKDNPAQHTVLRFAACDYFCEVFVNGSNVGNHEGGYTPFEFDISSALRNDGANELVVRVTDPPHDPKRNQQLFPQFLYDEIPHGKQNWYVQTGGLWQPVHVQLEPALFIRSIHVTAQINGNVEVTVLTLAFGGDYGVTQRVVIRDSNGAIVASNQPQSDQDALRHRFQIDVPYPRLWSPESPALYSAEVTIGGASARVRFGFRSLTTHNGKLYLNGKPFFMIGALDQDFYPATIYTPPSAEYIRDEMRKAKALGLNTLRCHIKICTPDYLDAADEVGMVIWYEIPSWNDEHHWTEQAAGRGMQVFREALERDWNHPSLLIQSIINESWGADLKQPEQRKWLAAAYNEAKKAVAPLGRLIDDNSACCENFHVKSDLADFHQYYSIPDHADQWSKWVADFATRPKWIWSAYGDSQPTGNEPLIVSEFGNWGLPRLPCAESDHRKIGSSDQPGSTGNNDVGSSDAQMIRSSDCQLPWWFSRDFNGREITMPEGVIDRFHQFKLDRIFRSYNELAEATQWHQFESLKYEIEQMRAQPNIAGYVITEFTDVNWESNGLMDIWRNPKVYAKELAQIQQQDATKIDWKRGEAPQLPSRTSKAAAVSVDPDVPGPLRRLRSAANAPVLLAAHWNNRVRDQLSSGKTVILLADSADALPANFPLQLKARANSNYNGDWISNFNWILPSSPAFEGIAFNKIMGFEAQAVTPNYVLLGLKPEQFGDVLSGVFYGWIHDNSALVLQAKYAKGKLLITTLRFNQYGQDAYATTLLDNMIRYVSSPQFAPALDLAASHEIFIPGSHTGRNDSYRDERQCRTISSSWMSAEISATLRHTQSASRICWME